MNPSPVNHRVGSREPTTGSGTRGGLQQGREQLILDFVNSYPESNKASYAFVDVANFKFANGKYKEAIKLSEKINLNTTIYQIEFGYDKSSIESWLYENTVVINKVYNEDTIGVEFKTSIGNHNKLQSLLNKA